MMRNTIHKALADHVNFLMYSTHHNQFHPLLLQSRHYRCYHVPIHTVVDIIPVTLVVGHIFLALLLLLVEYTVEQNNMLRPISEVNPSDVLSYPTIH